MAVSPIDAGDPNVGSPARTTRRKAKRFLAVAEAAEQLGISESTAYRAIRQGELPAKRILGRWLVPSRAIDRLEEQALAGDPAEQPRPTDPSVSPSQPLNGGEQP